LADGSLPSGMSGYSYRYQHAGSAWSAWQTTTDELGIVPGSHNGEIIALEIVPADQVGNPGPTKQVSVTVTGTGDPCGATANGYPSNCAAAAPTQQEEDAGLEDPVTLEPAPPPSGLAPLASVPATRYTVHVGGGGWATIRRNHGSYVIGNIRDTWSMDVADNSATNGSLQGRILGQYGDCGWVFAVGFQSSGSTTTGCQLDPNNPPPLPDFADKVNCLSCNAGSPTHLVHAYPMCPNVSPTPLNHQPKTCLSAISSRYTSHDEANGVTYTVYWRYFTNGRRFVLINDNKHGLRRTDATWLFIDRRALPRSLCTRETPAKAYRCGTTP
jgi:hypothetical protein